jgi:hypothetical protein
MRPKKPRNRASRPILLATSSGTRATGDKVALIFDGDVYGCGHRRGMKRTAARLAELA